VFQISRGKSGPHLPAQSFRSFLGPLGSSSSQHRPETGSAAKNLVLWCFGALVVLWCFGALVLWCFGAVVLWCFGGTRTVLVRSFRCFPRSSRCFFEGLGSFRLRNRSRCAQSLQLPLLARLRLLLRSCGGEAPLRCRNLHHSLHQSQRDPKEPT
jgi:hypothetical protein